MSHIFISHAGDDQETAVALAAGLEAAGFKSWYYERDCAPGKSYLLQTGKAVEDCSVVILLISKRSVLSSQVTKEVVRAVEADKPFIPVLCDLSHPEFQQLQPEWREAVGSAVSVPLPPEGVAAIVPRILIGLNALGIVPGQPLRARPVASAAKPPLKIYAAGAVVVAALIAAGVYRQHAGRPQQVAAMPQPAAAVPTVAPIAAPPLVAAAPLSMEAALVYKGKGGALPPVRDGMALTSLDQYGLYLRADQDCYVYVYQVDSRGSVARLFPNDDFHTGDNLLKAGEERWVPNDAEFFELDENKGTETIYVAASLRPLPGLEDKMLARASDLQQKFKTLSLMGVKGTARSEARRTRPLKGKSEKILMDQLKAARNFYYSISFEHR